MTIHSRGAYNASAPTNVHTFVRAPKILCHVTKVSFYFEALKTEDPKIIYWYSTIVLNDKCMKVKQYNIEADNQVAN